MTFLHSWANNLKLFVNKIKGNACYGGGEETIHDFHAQRKSVMHTYDGRCCFITSLFNMHDKKNVAGSLLPMIVTEGVTVNILPNQQYEFLMTTKEVANGYGVTEYNIRVHKMQHASELIEGKHYVLAVSIPNGELPGALKTAHNAILWTKRGIVRLGFFIKSERAKMFRDWAEELIIRVDQQADLFGNLPANTSKMVSHKRNHNRLTSDRLIRLLQLTHRIENSDLRTEIVNELMGGRAV